MFFPPRPARPMPLPPILKINQRKVTGRWPAEAVDEGELLHPFRGSTPTSPLSASPLDPQAGESEG